MNRRLLTLILVLLGVVALAGCGDDDSGDDTSMDRTDAGGAGRSGSGGGGGATAGRSGSGGSGGSGGSQAQSVECGTQTCESPAAAMGFITACCADQASSTCGTSLMGGPCAEASAGDSRCPALDVMGFIMIPSCCTDGNQCGIDASMFGMPGCTDLATAAEQAEMMGMGAGVEIPAPRACGDADAGTDDAGI